jgi:hypothetical protein
MQSDCSLGDRGVLVRPKRVRESDTRFREPATSSSDADAADLGRATPGCIAARRYQPPTDVSLRDQIAANERGRARESSDSVGSGVQPCTFTWKACIGVTPSGVEGSRGRAASGRNCGLRSLTSRSSCAWPPAPDPRHNEAPEGTGGRTGQSFRTGSEQVRSRYAPPETLARWPCGHRTRFPGPSRGSLPVAVWRFAPAPSGTTKCTGRAHDATTALSTNFTGNVVGLSPTFPPMWMACG